MNRSWQHDRKQNSENKHQMNQELQPNIFDQRRQDWRKGVECKIRVNSSLVASQSGLKSNLGAMSLVLY